MNRSSHGRPFGLRPRGGAYRGSRGTGRGGRNENSNPTQRFINTSSDGTTLLYSRLGIDNFGDPSLVDSVINSRKVIGEYSEDSERNFVNDRSYLHFLHAKYLPDAEIKEKTVDLDLTVSEIKEYSSTGSKDLENFLTWIINNKEAFDKELSYTSVSEGGGKFLMQKSVLINILSVPYRFNHEFKFYAYSLKGVIYFQKEYTVLPSSNHKRGNWAHKFEQYMTEEDTSKEVIGNEEFRAVISANLGSHKILFSATLDCANPEEFEDDFSDLSSFINLKCLEKADEFNYRFQMMYWYLGYVMSGVPKTLVGQRDENGICTQLKLYDVTDMLLLGKEFWNPVNCLFFASEALSFIKNQVESEPGSIFGIRKEPRKSQITCIKELDYENFLPEWFIQEIIEADEPDVRNIVDTNEEV